jgi:hypothetical protein
MMEVEEGDLSERRMMGGNVSVVFRDLNVEGVLVLVCPFLRSAGT